MLLIAPVDLRVRPRTLLLWLLVVNAISYSFSNCVALSRNVDLEILGGPQLHRLQGWYPFHNVSSLTLLDLSPKDSRILESISSVDFHWDNLHLEFTLKATPSGVCFYWFQTIQSAWVTLGILSCKVDTLHMLESNPHAGDCGSSLELKPVFWVDLTGLDTMLVLKVWNTCPVEVWTSSDLLDLRLDSKSSFVIEVLMLHTLKSFHMLKLVDPFLCYCMLLE